MFGRLVAVALAVLPPLAVPLALPACAHAHTGASPVVVASPAGVASPVVASPAVGASSAVVASPAVIASSAVGASSAVVASPVVASPVVASSAGVAQSVAVAPPARAGSWPAPVAATISASSAITQESDNPINDQGSNYNYRSYIDDVTPNVPGLQLEVLEFADRLVLRNKTGRTVTIYGYQEEPYAQVLANGTVRVNTSSPAYYLNQSFYGDVAVPSSATPAATPHWTVIDRTGELEWHDHRIHWMSPLTPPQVKDKSRRTLIFDWDVPIRVGAVPGAIYGQLFWVPEEGTSTPAWAIVAFVVIALAGLAIVIVRRRGRVGGPPRTAGMGAGAAGSGTAGAEAEGGAAGGAIESDRAKEVW